MSALHAGSTVSGSACLIDKAEQVTNTRDIWTVNALQRNTCSGRICQQRHSLFHKRMCICGMSSFHIFFFVLRIIPLQTDSSQHLYFPARNISEAKRNLYTNTNILRWNEHVGDILDPRRCRGLPHHVRPREAASDGHVFDSSLWYICTTIILPQKRPLLTNCKSNSISPC